MIDTIEFNKKEYPKLQAEGFAAQYAFPFAQKILSGDGFDIGCMKKEWSYPGSEAIDLDFDDNYDAMNLPDKKVDYIFSSHCLEHLHDWVGVLNYWTTKLKENGIIFLYLPHPDQEYWLPWNNRKHISILQPKYLKDYFTSKKFSKVFVTEGYDLNHSFYAIAQL